MLASQGQSGKVGRMNAARPQLVVENPKASETEPANCRGAAKLREEVDFVLGQESKEIAEALAQSSKSGKIQSIQFMYGLAKEREKAGEADGARTFRSIATEWTNSPEWSGELESDPAGEEGDTD